MKCHRITVIQTEPVDTIRKKDKITEKILTKKYAMHLTDILVL